MDNIEEKLYLMLRIIRKHEDKPDYDVLDDISVLHLSRNETRRLIGIAACEGLLEEPDYIETGRGRTIVSGQVKITEKGYKFLKTYLVR